MHVTFDHTLWRVDSGHLTQNHTVFESNLPQFNEVAFNMTAAKLPNALASSERSRADVVLQENIPFSALTRICYH